MPDRLYTIPLTSDLGGVRITHHVTDEAFRAGQARGYYRAVCGATVRVVSALEPTVRPHRKCLDIVAAAAAAAAAIPEQSRARRRHRGLLSRGGGR